MGNSSSTDPDAASHDDDPFDGVDTLGYRVLGVQPNSPASQAGLVSFLDFLVGAEGKFLLGSGEGLEEGDEYDDVDFPALLEEYKNKPLELLVWNIKSQSERLVQIVPRSDWGGAGLLGVTIRLDNYAGAEERIIRVLSVEEQSPAAVAGLIPMKDFLLGTTHVSLDTTDTLAALLQQHEDRVVEFYVYNTDTDLVRTVALMPTLSWGGMGLLGAEVGIGYLHRLPKEVTGTDGSSVERKVRYVGGGGSAPGPAAASSTNENGGVAVAAGPASPADGGVTAGASSAQDQCQGSRQAEQQDAQNPQRPPQQQQQQENGTNGALLLEVVPQLEMEVAADSDDSDSGVEEIPVPQKQRNTNLATERQEQIGNQQQQVRQQSPQQQQTTPDVTVPTQTTPDVTVPTQTTPDVTVPTQPVGDSLTGTMAAPPVASEATLPAPAGREGKHLASNLQQVVTLPPVAPAQGNPAEAPAATSSGPAFIRSRPSHITPPKPSRVVPGRSPSLDDVRAVFESPPPMNNGGDSASTDQYGGTPASSSSLQDATPSYPSAAPMVAGGGALSSPFNTFMPPPPKLHYSTPPASTFGS